MQHQVLTVSVSQLNHYIKRVMDANSYLSDIIVTGELSNVKLHSSGHLYASLKDEGSLIKMVMFKANTFHLRFHPENGMRVLVRGRISVYERDGAYQLYAESMEPDGVGALFAAFEALKAKLSAEGLFDEQYKKPLPRFPRRIGIVTAKTGAAVQDMIHVSGRRYPLAELVLVPVAVQGVGAAEEIAAAIRFLNKNRLCDVMIVGRGGGSLEDLWAFNEEVVARAIFASDIPVVSAVGHETDFTISDFVADFRAPTPSAAAEMVCPSGQELSSVLTGMKSRLQTALFHFTEVKKQRLTRLTESYGFRHLPDALSEHKQYVDALTKSAENALCAILQQGRHVFEKNVAKLDALSPLKTLSRGYSVAYTPNGEIISSVSETASGEPFSLRLKDGEADCVFR